MISRIGVAVMAAALVLYLGVIVWLAVLFFAGGTAVSIAMGVALCVLAPIGAWALVRELAFGFAADRLGRALEAEGGEPRDEVALMPSGRVVKDEAEPLLARYRAAAEGSPAWQDHFRLGIVQDAAGRRKDARASIREAIRVDKAARA